MDRKLRRSPDPAAPDAGPLAYVSIYGMIGGGATAVIYNAYGIALEAFVFPKVLPPETPRLTYGQMAGMIMVPIAALLGTGIGASLALGRRGRLSLSASMAAATSGVVAAVVAKLWMDSLSRYGPDPSDWVLCIPLLAGSLVGLVVGLLVSVMAITRSIRCRFGERGR